MIRTPRMAGLELAFERMAPARAAAASETSTNRPSCSAATIRTARLPRVTNTKAEQGVRFQRRYVGDNEVGLQQQPIHSAGDGATSVEAGGVGQHASHAGVLLNSRLDEGVVDQQLAEVEV